MKKLYLIASAILFTGMPQTALASKRIVDKVFLVHGFLGRSTQLNPVKRRLEKSGFQCFSPGLKPSDARTGLEDLAQQLKAEIDQHCSPLEPIVVIGYSMGGLVSRYYLQNLGGAERCATFISISSPHHGSNFARVYPGLGASQMRPGSDFLAELESTENRLEGLPLVSYRTPLDLMILPASSSIWNCADNRCYTVAMHPLMLRSNQVLNDIERRLLGKDSP